MRRSAGNRHRVQFQAMLGLFAVLTAGVGVAENIDPDDDASQYAWSENAGWLNAEPGGESGPGIEVVDFVLTGWLWAENAGWISLSCSNTGSCATAKYGVVNDGHGTLGGFGWGENVGWINFAPSTGGVVIDTETGEFGGYAWGENVGWIGFSCSNTGSCGASDYGIKTAWCQDTVGNPSGSADIRLSRVGDDVQLSQLVAAGGATWHEVVRGDLSTLRSSGGDYSAATDDCVADDVTTENAIVSGTPVLVPGDGYWYLVRRVNCKGKGTFDSGGGMQEGLRDAEIALSTGNCP